MPLRQVYCSWEKQANTKTALKNVKNALTQFFSLILCYGAMVLMENWTPCMAKLEKLALHSMLRWTSTNKKVTSHGPLQHKSLFPSGSKSPLTNIHHIDPWQPVCGRQLASCNEIKKKRYRQYFIDDASYSKLYLVAACLGPDFLFKSIQAHCVQRTGPILQWRKKRPCYVNSQKGHTATLAL
jgi:hypothetical protein